MILQVMIVYIPGLNTFFGMGPMDGIQWGIAFGCAIITFVLVEIEKFFNDVIFKKYIRPCMRSIEYTYCCLGCINTIQGGKDLTGRPQTIEGILLRENEKTKNLEESGVDEVTNHSYAKPLKI